MITATAKKTGSFKKVGKNMRFATAKALTMTAKQGQTAAIASIKSHFTVRNTWLNPSNQLGVRIKPAKKDDLEAHVKTGAGFLGKFETGEDKLPKRKALAIPTGNVRRNKRDIITKANRPAALRNKRTFILNTKRGPVLFQRKYKGKRSHIVALYNLRPRAKIRKRVTFYEPVRRVAMNNFNKNFRESLISAFVTAR